jgi:hypothetical protein
MTDFDPGKHLTKIGKGNREADYLEVKWRLVWFRHRHPEGSIETEHIIIDKDIAVFKATARYDIGEGFGGVATGYGSEQPKDFGDYIEKAETKAVGRALAMLGFGTQFAPEMDEGERIVDSPIVRNNTTDEEKTAGLTIPDHSKYVEAMTPRTVPPVVARNNEPKTMKDITGRRGQQKPMSEPQANLIRGLIKQKFQPALGEDGALHHDPKALSRFLRQHNVTIDPSNFSTFDASIVIDHLKALPDYEEEAPPTEYQEQDLGLDEEALEQAVPRRDWSN